MRRLCQTYGPATSLVRVRGDFVATPATHLHDAVLWLQTLLLSHLLASITTSATTNEGSDSRAGSEVGQLQGFLVDVEGDAGIVRLDVAGDADGTLRTLVARRLKEDLGAASVELRVRRVGNRRVQSKDLGPGEIVAALEAGREVDRQLVVVDAIGILSTKLLVAPEVLLLVVALVPNLEPTVANACGVSVRCSGAVGGHPYQCR